MAETEIVRGPFKGGPDVNLIRKAGLTPEEVAMFADVLKALGYRVVRLAPASVSGVTGIQNTYYIDEEL